MRKDSVQMNSIRFNSIAFILCYTGFAQINNNDDEQNILTMELKLIEQKLMSTNMSSAELNKVWVVFKCT